MHASICRCAFTTAIVRGSRGPRTAARSAHFKDYDDLVSDAAAGRLPAVAFYKPEGDLNQHPGYASLQAGDQPRHAGLGEQHVVAQLGDTQTVRRRSQGVQDAVLARVQLAPHLAGLELAVGCDVGLMAQVDRSLLRRAIGNLIANSIAHTRRGHSISILGKDDGTSMSVEVVDTGQGISAEHLPHVFDRFYRADQNRSTTEGHLGLGLSIVKSIALLHGGSVEIESVVGQGTTVRIRLPKTIERASA